MTWHTTCTTKATVHIDTQAAIEQGVTCEFWIEVIFDCWLCIIEKLWLSWVLIFKRGLSNMLCDRSWGPVKNQIQGACWDNWKKYPCPSATNCSFGLQEENCHLVFCCYPHKCSGHSQYCMQGISIFPQSFNKGSWDFPFMAEQQCLQYQFLRSFQLMEAIWTS